MGERLQKSTFSVSCYLNGAIHLPLSCAFFTLGQDDAVLADHPEVGRFFNNITIAIVAAFLLGASILSASF